MRKRLSIFLPIVVAVLMVLTMATPALATPPFPDGEEAAVTLQQLGEADQGPAARRAKPKDQPNMKDYLRARQRQELLAAGKTAEANALQLEGTDRVLMILVEFAGTDVFTWNPGDTWDPYGRADPDEAVYDDDGNLVYGDCSNIITQTAVFTYTGPLHNDIPRPVSLEDRSADSIWTEDFSPEWFDGFLFGDGVVFDYDMEDGTPVYEDFSGQSVADYFDDLSDGRYTITGDVVGWVQLPHSVWYYSADQCPGKRSPYDPDINDNGMIPGAGTEGMLVSDALDAVNAISDTLAWDFDWADYDLDGDGTIDRLWIVHSGYGEEDSTTLLNRTDYGESAVWSHSGGITPYEVAPGIFARSYIMMAENGGIGVFAHEYGHNLGAIDLYSYNPGEASAGFWTVMCDDWTGYPIGFEPSAMDPYHLDQYWGWLDPYVVTDPTQVYEVTLGQASLFPGGEDVYRGARIELPDGTFELPVSVWQGDSYWWGNQKDAANAMMTTVDPIAIPEAGATLSFDLVYDIEDEWDFLWVQVSEDGVTWDPNDTLSNENTKCEHDSGWIGGLNGFPEDLCAAGIGGFWGWNENWPDPEVQAFDLSAYAGQSIYLRFWFMTDWATHYTGAFIDDIQVWSEGDPLFADDAESGDAKWVYQAPWVRSDGTMPYTHNLYLQWRNVNDNGGYDSALGDERWRFGPANSGLLVWYANSFYTDNEILGYVEDDPGFGPKGAALVVDSHPYPYRDPNEEPSGLGRENTNVTTRMQMRDAPFTLQDTVDFTLADPYVIETTDFSGRLAVSSFHDSMGYYPGVADEGDGTYWSTINWDSSLAMPAMAPYSIAAAPDYPGYHVQYVAGWGGWYGFWGWWPPGTGNPGDDDVQYGWHVELVEEAEDHTSATVRIWNSRKELIVSFEPDTTTAETGDELAYTCDVENIGTKVDGLVVIPLDTDKVEYVPKSAFGGVAPMPCGFSAEELAELYASGGWKSLAEVALSNAADICSIVGAKNLGSGMGAEFGFSVEVKVGGGDIDMAAHFFEQGELLQVEVADTVNVTARIYLPMLFKSYTYVAPAEFTILHTNDFHGRLETDSNGRGGSAYMAGVINDIRDEEGEDSVFLVDAGDIFFGAPPISQLMMGESTIEVYNMLGYDVAAFGNHEFDKGQEVLIDRVEQSDFPWLGANIVLEGTEWEHPAWIKPYVILSKGGVDLGIIGVDTDETPLVTLKGTTEGLEFTHLYDAVLHYYDEVMAKADAVIVLAHMGTDDSGEFEGLETVAQELIDAGKPVDLMIGGHQHQALYEPVMVGDTAIVAAGYYGRWLGRVDVSVDFDTKELTVEDYELITINNELEADPEVEAEVAYWAEQVAPYVEQLVGYSNVDLVRDYNAESNVGDLVADSMLWKADEYDDGEVNGSVDIAFTNPGGLRADILAPEGVELPYEVTWGDTFNVLPFGNTLFLMDLTGEQIQTLLDQSATLYKGILQTAGATWYWYNDCNCDAPTNSGAYGAMVGGEPLDPEETYRVVTNNFLAGGQDGWVTFADGTDRWDTYFDMQEGLNEYIEWYNDDVGPIDYEVEGRIVKMDKLITILHTNDVHGTFPTASYYGTPEGVTYLASHIAAERAKNPNTLLLDAGDTFQGNAFAQYFRNDTPNPIAGAMNMLDYDAMTIGNHEYNFGPETFATMLGQLDCPILGSANVDDDGSYGFINDNVEDYINLDVDGVKVSIFGLTNPRVYRYELPTNIPGLTFHPATETAASLVPTILATEEPDLLIGLTHIGYQPYGDEQDSDELVAQEVAGIDVIIGGHSHTRLDPSVMVTSAVNPEGTLVAQTGRYAQYLGKVTVGLVGDEMSGYDVVVREGYLLPAGDVEPDPGLVAYLVPFEAELDAYTSTEIGQTTAPLDALEAYTEETTGANVQTDAAVLELTQNGIDVDFYLSGAMSNRRVADGATEENPVTLIVNDMYTLMPYENSLVVMEMNGPQIKAVLERAYRNWWYYNYTEDYGGYSHYTTCMLDINSGGVITYLDTYPDLPDGDNVLSLVFDGTAVDFTDADTYYNVGTVNYVAAGSCNFNNAGETIWPLDQVTADTQYYVRDSVIDYIEHEGTISPAVEGRLQFIPAPRVTILHTNDTHAHLESFEPFGEALQGGVARRYTAIQEVKAETDNVILVDAGDAFQGTLYFNVWQGEEEAYFMNALGYQAMVVGNHEFDAGPAVLADFIGLADFPVLGANVDAAADPDLAGLIPAYTILDVGDEQVGVLGLTTEEVPILSSPGPNVVFNDIVASAQATVATLDGLGIDKIVALSHNGYNVDQALAAAVDGIDVIVSGHSHTLLGSMEGAAGPYPTEVTSPGGDTVLIVSAYEWGKYLGRINVTFTLDGEVRGYSGEPIFIDESFVEDPTIAADVATFAEPIEDLKNTIVGQTAVDLDGTRAVVRGAESNLGNLICDAMLAETAGEGTQICVQNGGGIRASIPAGDVTMGQVLEVLPYGNQIATFGLTGADVWAALENGVSQFESEAGRFPQVGGLRYSFDPTQEVGARIVSVDVKNAVGGYDPIDLGTVYKLASNDFMRGGGDGYDVFANNAIDPYDAGAVLADAVADYIAANSPVSPAVEGRITNLSP